MNWEEAITITIQKYDDGGARFRVHLYGVQVGECSVDTDELAIQFLQMCADAPTEIWKRLGDVP